MMASMFMNDQFNSHTPVLLSEAVDQLVTSPSGIYIDATFGRGSHARAILERLNKDGRLIAFDKDAEAVEYAHAYFHTQQFFIQHDSFVRLYDFINKQNLVGKITGVLFDLGVSSPQLDDAKRGFSFSKAGDLDMRMDQSKGIQALSWLQEVDEKELADVLWRYGEERFSKRIARVIIAARKTAPITNTLELARIVAKAYPYKKHNKKHTEKHPATKTFQAIRIKINQELEELTEALPQALEVLSVGGRLAVISFHSLEDRIVKQFIRQHEKGKQLPRRLPIKAHDFVPKLKTIGKPITPSAKEMNLNPRSRSATLRIAEKQS